MREKCTEEVKTRVPYSAKLELHRLAHEAGMTVSEYARNVLMIHVFGKEEMINRQVNSLEVVANRGRQ